MTIFSDSSILDEEEVQFLLDLLPKFDERTPDVFIVDRWKSIAELTGKQSDLYGRYTIMKKIVKTKTFSAYNYEHNIIFVYLFNLPYRDPFLTKLHAVFCLFHEMRHHQQFCFNRSRLLSHLDDLSTAVNLSSYSFSWAEKDANKHAVKWMRINRKAINEKFKLHSFRWDVGVNTNKRLRIISNG